MMKRNFSYKRSAKNTRRNRPLEEYHAEKEHKKPWKKVKMGKLQVPVFRLRGILAYSLVGITIVGLVYGTIAYQENMRCKDISITIKESPRAAFLNIDDIVALLGYEEEVALIGQKMKDIDLEGLEQELEEHPTIKNAEVFRSMKGIVYMEVELREAIARLVNNNGTYIYIDKEGYKFPVSPHNTENVVLIRGNFDEPVSPVDSFHCSTIGESLKVLDFVRTHEFWQGKISEIALRQNGELVLYPQLGDMYMEFGFPIRVEEKFENLQAFYHQVVHKVGWNYYQKVSVKYKGQVVARKS